MMAELGSERQNELREVEAGLVGIGTTPSFAIGQRALLVQTPGGNILWDCLSLLDDPTIAAVRALGGIRAIAISHPHYFAAMVEWAHAFDAPIYLHAAEREWVMRPDPAVTFWDGETHDLGDGLTLIRCGGHYVGGQVLHWSAGADGSGVLLTGDILQVVSDRRYLSFMYSYPNLIPLPVASVQRIVAAVEPFAFDRIYGRGGTGSSRPARKRPSPAPPSATSRRSRAVYRISACNWQQIRRCDRSEGEIEIAGPLILMDERPLHAGRKCSLRSARAGDVGSVATRPRSDRQHGPRRRREPRP